MKYSKFPGKRKESQIRTVVLAAVVLAICAVCIKAGCNAVRTAGSESVRKEQITIVIDAGHGGIDPGKVGVNNALEKDINLNIALLLRQYLEANDVKVVLTREEDIGLYEESDSNKKVRDLKNRISLIEENSPVLTVSIHQNSYHEPEIHGAQVFYYDGSEKSMQLAQLLQAVLIREVDPDNTRVAKANDSYYLLKKTTSTIVIVECGFLSNPEEAEMLSTEAYQKEMAWAIHLGIMQYLNNCT